MELGTIGWIDLTVTDAEGIRDFYAAVVGWQSDAVDMSDYQDFCMLPKDGEPAAGICHARGANAAIPPGWMIYITVENLDESLKQCEHLGGEVLGEPRSMGKDRYCVIRDPSGATCALYQSGDKTID